MKIGILTYHRVINDGSVLQAYCTQQLLSCCFPNATIEIIDYAPAKLWWTEYIKIFKKRPPFINSTQYFRIKSIAKFIKAYIKLSQADCYTDNLQKAIHFIDQQNYDAVFVGSDTVWEARVSKYVPHPPNIFYLPGLNRIKKISFAASADPIQDEFVADEKMINSIATHLRSFDYITVRDDPTINYLIELGINEQNIHFLPDPTLQYNFKSLLQIPNISKNKPLAGIALGGGILKKSLIHQLENEGYSIIDFFDLKIDGSAISGASGSLNIRLGIYSMLDLLVTDRFHGSIFCLKLSGSPVIFIEKAQKWPKANSKGRDLFRRLRIEQMVFRYEGGDVSKNLIQGYLNIWSSLQIDLYGKLKQFENSIGRIIEYLRTNIVS